MTSAEPTNTERSTVDTATAKDAPLTLSALLADAMKAKNSQKQWYERDSKSNHDQKPGRPPHGTRRSMGKR